LRHSFSRRDFRIQRTLSQDVMPHNSPMLRSSKALGSTSELVSLFSAIWS